MKKIKVALAFIFVISFFVVKNCTFATTNNLKSTDLIRLWDNDLNIDFTVTNNTTIDDIKKVLGEPKITTDSCFGGHAYTFYKDNYSCYLYVETVPDDEYIFSYGTVWKNYQIYGSGSGYSINNVGNDAFQGYNITSGETILGGVYYNRNRYIGTPNNTVDVYVNAYNSNPTHYLKCISEHGVEMYKAVSVINGYKCNIKFDDDFFYINEQLKETGSSIRKYVNSMDKGTYCDMLGARSNTLLVTNTHLHFLNPAMFANMFYQNSLNKVDRTGDNNIAVFDYVQDKNLLTAILVSKDLFKKDGKIDLTQDELNKYYAGKSEYDKAISYLNKDSGIYSSNPVISPASGLYAGELLENKKIGIVCYINAIRIAAGLPSFSLDNSLFSYAQHTATLMSYRWNSLRLEITHSPEQPAGVTDEFFKASRGGFPECLAWTTNTSLNSSMMTGYVNGFIDDQDESSLNLSHRSLLLNPIFNKIGFGISQNIGAIELSSSKSSDVFLKAWPSEGVTFLETLSERPFYWSAQFLDKYTVVSGKTQVNVKCLNTGDSWTFKNEESSSSRKYEIRTDYITELNNMVIFYDSSIIPQADYVYEITISGIKDSSGNSTSYTYRSAFKYADDSNVPTQAENVTINSGSLSLVAGKSDVYYVPVGEESKLSVNMDSSITDQKVTWVSDNINVKVTQNGIVTPLADVDDTVTITLIYDATGEQDTIKLKTYIKVDKVELSNKKLDMIAGQNNTETIKIKTIPEEANEVLKIDWVVKTQANPTIEYSYNSSDISKYIEITKVDDRTINVKAISAEAENNVFTIIAKVKGISADFTGSCAVTVTVPLESIRFSNNNSSNKNLSIVMDSNGKYSETINYNNFYNLNNTDIIKFKVNLYPKNTTVSKEVTWSLKNNDNGVLSFSDSNGSFKVNKPGTVSIVATSNADSSISSQLDLTINSTLESISIIQQNQDVNLEYNSSSKTYSATRSITVERKPSIDNTKLIYTSSNSNIATVDSNGLVKFMGKVGKVTITVRDISNTYSDTITYNVQIPVSSILFSDNNVKIKVGSTYSNVISYNPKESESLAKQNVIYSSSDNSIATVNSNGVVTGVSYGKAKISASIPERYTNSGTTITASYYVYVLNPVEDIVLSGQSTAVMENTPTIQYTVKPTNSNDDEISYIWNSSNPDVATIDSNGKAILKSVGFTTISVTAKIHNIYEDRTITKSINLTVNSIYKPAYLKGDLDRNGIVDSNDASYALYLYKTGNYSSEDIMIGDMDGNNIIDSNDASEILKLYKEK